MNIRPIDIARKLNVSTTTLRKYEQLGLIPPVPRTVSKYRVYTVEHTAYFICIREMLAGFTLSYISQILKEVLAKKIDSALWMANKAQAELQQEKIIYEKIILNLLHKSDSHVKTNHRLLTINAVSQETGVPATTIRYWDQIGLISADRCTENNYRIFMEEHIRQILTIHALKVSFYSNHHKKYSVDRAKEELKEFDYNDRNRIITIANDIKRHLDSVNRGQISGISALHNLCIQIEANHFDHPI